MTSHKTNPTKKDLWLVEEQRAGHEKYQREKLGNGHQVKEKAAPV